MWLWHKSDTSQLWDLGVLDLQFKMEFHFLFKISLGSKNYFVRI